MTIMSRSGDRFKFRIRPSSSFMSSSPRFPDAKSTVPPVGSYSVDRVRNSPSNYRNSYGGTGSQSSSFSSTRRRDLNEYLISPSAKSTSAYVGPGSYSSSHGPMPTTPKQRPASANSGSAVFKSTTPRFSASKDRSPPVGSYSPSLLPRSSTADPLHEPKASPRMSSPTNRHNLEEYFVSRDAVERVFVGPGSYNTAMPSTPRSTRSDPSFRSTSPRFERPRLQSPPVGSYSPEKSRLSGSISASVRDLKFHRPSSPTSAFTSSGHNIDEVFINREQRDTYYVGPGSYSPKLVDDNQRSRASSPRRSTSVERMSPSFVSKTERFTYQKPAEDTPAVGSYSPSNFPPPLFDSPRQQHDVSTSSFKSPRRNTAESFVKPSPSSSHVGPGSYSSSSSSMRTRVQSQSPRDMRSPSFRSTTDRFYVKDLGVPPVGSYTKSLIRRSDSSSSGGNSGNNSYSGNGRNRSPSGSRSFRSSGHNLDSVFLKRDDSDRTFVGPGSYHIPSTLNDGYERHV